MCNPIISAVVSAAGTIANAAQGAAAERARARIARNNALTERRMAGFEAQRERDRLRRRISARRARALASGVAIAGSPVEVILEEAGQAEVAIAGNTFKREARARNFRAQANVRRSNAGAALSGAAARAIAPVIDKSPGQTGRGIPRPAGRG